MKLKHPIQTKGGLVTELIFRRPKAADMIAIGDHMSLLISSGATADDNKLLAAANSVRSANIRAMVAVVGHMSGIGDEAAAELDFVDLTAACEEALTQAGEPQGSAGEPQTGA